jgi:hypothetical protein
VLGKADRKFSAADPGIAVLEVKEIPQFKRLVGPGDLKAMALCQLKGPNVLALWKIIAVENTPDM